MECDYLMLMETAAGHDAFVDTLPVFAKFEGVADIDNYRPLPDGWALATADIVGSTKAIAGRALQGRQHGRRQRHFGAC